MITRSIHHQQRGATLIVALIMLLLVTLVVSGSFSLSSINLKSVSNMQVRQEALAAANAILEQVIGSPFINDVAATAGDLNVDINNDGVDDYVVSIAVPDCIRAMDAPGAEASSEGLGLPSNLWNTTWLLQATVTDPASGAQSVVQTAVRVQLTDSVKSAVCP